jgi:hypothetical protein
MYTANKLGRLFNFTNKEMQIKQNKVRIFSLFPLENIVK